MNYAVHTQIRDKHDVACFVNGVKIGIILVVIVFTIILFFPH